MSVHTAPELARRYRSIDEFEEDLAEQAALEAKRRRELQRRAANRSRARRIARAERSGRVRFSVLASSLTLTVVVVVVVMFETLAWLVGG
jgi:cytochrome c-type biogenesis protein CcmH/NrfG